MIESVCEWLGNHPAVSLVLLACFGFFWVWLLVAIANARSPLDDQPGRERDEHEDGIPW